MNTLARRLLVSTCVLLTLMLVASWIVGTLSARRFADEMNQALNRSIAMYIVDRGPLVVDGEVMEGRLRDVAAQAMVLNPAVSIYLLDPAGRVIWPRTAASNRRVDLRPIREFLAADAAQHVAIYGDDPAQPSSQRVFSVAPVRSSQRDSGYVYVLLGGAERGALVRSIADSHILRAGSGGLLLMLGFALCAAWALTIHLTQPLTRLHGRIVDAGLELGVAIDQAPARSRSDLEQISAVFDALAKRIRCQLDDLRSGDRLRRDLYAQASHDLRTPLTAMRGYLETLAADDGALGLKRRAQFTQVALRHCDRLQRLVEQIFVLARLETAVLPIKPEPVVAGELVQDVVASLQLDADRAGIDLRIEICPDAPPVTADIALLETVLVNLLDNALRHAPRGGRVSVRVQVEPAVAGVAIAVCDNGPGIAAADLDRVRRPFETGPGGRTGLGLAIVHRIVELHGSALQIDSALGKGTELRFVLAAAPATAREDFVTSIETHSGYASGCGRAYTQGEIR